MAIAEPFLNTENREAIEKALRATADDRSQPKDEQAASAASRTKRPRSSSRRLTPDEVQTLAEAYTHGATIKALAAQWGIHRTTVMDHLKRTGVQTRRSKPKLTDTQTLEAAHLYQDGHSLASLGDRYHLNPETIRRALTRACVTMRPQGKKRSQ